MNRQEDSRPDSPRHAFIVGIVATVASSLILEAARVFDLVGAGPCTEAIIAFLLIRIYPEPRSLRWSFKSVALLLAAGLLLALGWIGAIGWWQVSSRFTEWTQYPFYFIVIGFISAVVTAPLFEEKVVRHLLLCGAARITNTLFASILVSALFALAHPGNRIWSFIVSVLLCWLAIKWGANSFQRAIVHGTLNLMVMLWHLAGGSGKF